MVPSCGLINKINGTFDHTLGDHTRTEADQRLGLISPDTRPRPVNRLRVRRAFVKYF